MTLSQADETLFTYLKVLGLRTLGLMSHVTIPSGMATYRPGL